MFFGAAVFQKCCRGVGEQPTFAEQIRFCNLFFLLQLHFLKLTNSQFDYFCETSCKFGQGNGAIAACWQAKAGVEPPFAGWERLLFLEQYFVKNIILYKITIDCWKTCPILAVSYASGFPRRAPVFQKAGGYWQDWRII